MSAHPHAENMRLYAEDAAETVKPWERWEYMSSFDNGWSTCGDCPLWVANMAYRRKPKPLDLWMNIYSDGRRVAHNSLKRAISAADSDPTNSLLRAAVHMREVME